MIRNLPPSKMSSSHFLKLSLYFFLVFKTQTLVTSSLNSVVVFDIVHLSKFPVPRVWPKSIICANLLWASRQSAANSNPHPAPKPIYFYIYAKQSNSCVQNLFLCLSVESAVWMQHLPAPQHFLFTGRWNTHNKQHCIFSGLSGVCICYQLSACFDVLPPVSKAGFTPKGNVDRWGHRKASFSLQLQSLTIVVKKRKKKR